MNSKSWGIIALLGPIIILAISYFLIINPILETNVALDQEIESKENDLIAQQTRLTELQSMTPSEIQQIEDTHREITSLLPASLNDAEIYGLIETAKNNANIVLTSISLTPTPDGSIRSNAVGYPITITGTGGKQNVLNFVSNVQNMDTLFVINNLDLTPNENNYDFNITAHTFTS